MLLMMFNLIQVHRRVPWLVWIIVGLVFLAGLSLLVYFMKRMKRAEKAAERELSLKQSSLFVTDEPGLDETSIGQSEEKPEPLATELAETEPLTPVPLAPVTPVQSAEVEPADIEEDEPTEIEAEVPIIPPQKAGPQAPEIAAPQSVTEPLPVEKEPVSVEQKEPEDAPVFDDEVWAALEKVEHEAESVPETREFGRKLPARVEHRASTEPLVSESKRWEMPMIEPLAPREQSAIAEQKPSPEIKSAEPAQIVAAASTADVPVQVETMTTRVKPGSILGIPDDPEAGPLILGEPQRDASEAGITSLSGYGKVNESSGKWGTVTLVATVLVIAGLIFAYVRSGWFHEKVNSFINRFRGGEQAATVEQPKSDLPRAQIFPARSQPDKNIAKAHGAVYNISGEPLTGLSLEVTLEHADGSSEPRTVELKPNQIAPGQQAVYDFEYDGRQITGYRISKLFSDSVEVKYITPSRSQ